MTLHKRLLLAICTTLATIAVSACGNKSDSSRGAAGSGSNVAAAKAEAKIEGPKDNLPPFAAQWDMPARKAAWQGAWAGEGMFLGDTAAWEIKGDDVTFVNKKGEQKYRLTIDSPCTAGFAATKAMGSDMESGGWESVYTIKDGELITGLGDAGSRKGNAAVVCGGGDVLVFDGTTCTDWANHFGDRWESSPGKCGFKKNDKGSGDEVFWYNLHDYETVLAIDGDVIWSDQLAHGHAKKMPNLAAAKAEQKL